MIALLMAASMLFPRASARDLSGRPHELPQAFQEPTVVLLGFSYASRFSVEKWTTALAHVAKGQIRVISMPVYGGLAAIARPLIDSAMARATPARERPFIWTTVDRDAIVRGLKLSDPDGALAVVVVDGKDTVRLVERGLPSKGSLDAVSDTWRQLVATGSVQN